MRRGGLAALFAALFLAVAPTAAEEEDGGSALERFIERNLSSAGREVRVSGFEGVLSSRARAAEITIADAAGVWLRLSGVELDWSRLALLRGDLRIDRLAAARIDLSRLPAPETAALPTPEAGPGFALPELPVSVAIGDIAAPNIAIGAEVLGEAVEIALEGRARIAGGAGSARLSVLRTDGREGRFVLDGSFDNATRQTRLLLDLAEGAGGIAATRLGLPGAPAIALSVAGEGPLEDFVARIALASEGTERLAGEVALRAPPEEPGTRRFAARLSGDLRPLLAPDYRAFFGPDATLALEGQRGAAGPEVGVER